MIWGILFSKAHLNIPGNTNTLLIWFGKSDLPVAIIFAQASFATSGMISGTGLDIANMIGSDAIDFTISAVSAPATDTHINKSLHCTASSKPHLMQPFPLGSKIQAVFVTFVNISFVGLSRSLPA